MSQIINKFIEAATGTTVTGVTGDKIRLNNAQPLRARNAANTADVNIIQVNASNVIEMQGALSMNTNKITNLVNPTAGSQEAATANYVDAAITAAAGANKALSNLASVAINASLLPGTDNTIAVGSGTLRYTSLNSLSNVIYGSTSGALTLNANAATTSYSLTFPAAQGGTSTMLQNNGSGVLTWVASAGGSVTSVALTAPSFLTVSGSPITTSGTLALSLATQTANTVFAGPASGAAAAPTFRALVSLDIPNNAANTTGTASNITATSNSTLTTLSALSLPGSQVTGNIAGNSANVTGTVAIANGGTGQTTTAAAFNALNPMTTTGDMIYESATGVASRLAIGSTNQVLTVIAGIPSWQSAAGGGANTALSNLTAVAINTSLLPGTDNSINVGSASLRFATVFTENVNSGNAALVVTSGNTSGSTSPAVTLSSGTASGTADTGSVTVSSGQPATGQSGFVSVQTSQPGVSGNSSGLITITTGNTSGAISGSINIKTGNTAGSTSSALVSITTGNGSSGTASSGDVSIATGTVSGTGTRGSVNLAGTTINLNATTNISANSKQINNLATPTTGTDAATKAYVDLVSAAAIPNKETFVLASGDITNQYIDLAQVADTNSILFMVKGSGYLLEGASYDYSVSYTGGVGGKTRITFLNQLATAGASALVATDVVQVNYIY